MLVGSVPPYSTKSLNAFGYQYKSKNIEIFLTLPLAEAMQVMFSIVPVILRTLRRVLLCCRVVYLTQVVYVISLS